MKGLSSIVTKILILSLVIALFFVLGWLGILPVKAMLVLVNTVLIGTALFLLADFMISSRMTGRE